MMVSFKWFFALFFDGILSLIEKRCEKVKFRFLEKELINEPKSNKND